MRILAKAKINVAAKGQRKYQEDGLHHVIDSIEKNQMLLKIYLFNLLLIRKNG